MLPHNHKTRLTDRVLKLTPIHVSVIYQIIRVSVPFWENSTEFPQSTIDSECAQDGARSLN